MSKLISVIIPAYNAERYIADTIRSVINQTYSVNEIIVVDDGSTDQTYAVAKKFERNGVLVIKQPNQGASAARNSGLNQCSGDYIQFLDADDLLGPSKIEEQMKAIEKSGDGCIYSGRWKVFYENMNEPTQFHSNELWKSFTSPVDWLVVAWSKQMWMHPSTWLTPRALIENAGLWDESLSLHDDGEFFCRVLLQSKGIVFCEESVSYYRKGINDSLSSIVSAKAVLSHFRICELYEHHLLNYENSLVNRRACASNYLAFYYDHFPGNIALREKALLAVARLGGSDLRPYGTELFHLLNPVFGWRIAKLIERFYYGNGLNWGSIKKRVANRN